MISTSRITKRLMQWTLLCWVACVVFAGTLALPGTSFGAWVTDSFNPTLACNPDRPDPTDCVHVVTMQSDGSILVGGYISSPNSWLARFTSTGSPDSTFNSNVAALNLDGTVDEIVIQSNGQIIIGGNFTQPYRGIARLNSTGTLDTTFNPQLTNCDPSETDTTAVTALALQGDGNLLVGGTFKNVGGLATCPAISTSYTTTNLHPFFVRLKTAGTGTGALDTNFQANVSSTVESIVTVESSSQILVGGYFYKLNCTYCGTTSAPTTTYQIYSNPTISVPACIDSDGVTYVNYGQCMSNNPSHNPPINTIDVSYVSLIKMSDGSQVSSFQSQRMAGEDMVFAIARQSDGSVVLGGGVETPGDGQPYLQRLTSSGDIDPTYNPNPSGPVNALIMQTGDNLITGGSFTVINAVTMNNIARLSSNDVLDSTFNPNANGQVKSIYSSSTGTQVLIGGGFTQIGITPRTYVARLINDGKTTTVTAISAPTAAYGAANVSILVSSATGTPTGSVGLRLDSGPTTTLTLSNGSALFSTPTATVGSHALTATYAGTASYEASFATGTLTVTPALLTVTANSVSRPFLASNPTFTANYTGFVNGQTISVLTGTASLTTTAIATSPVGTYPINAAAGTLSAANYGFTFINGVLTVTQATSTTSLSSNSSTTTYGNPVTFTATVNVNATGSVTFYDGGSPMGIGTLTGGLATYTAPLLSGGTHTISAVYSGDTSFSGSTSSNLIQTITKLPTISVVSSSSPNPSPFGSPVTFIAAVTTGATGTVTFKDGATAIGTGTLSGGIATYSTSTLSVSGSPHTITAVYAGDTNYATSTSTGYSQSISQTASTTSIGSSVNPSAYGSLVTFTATVNSSATGTVAFKDGATVMGTSTLSGGIATYSTSTLSVSGSPHSIMAVYAGDANYATSSSGILPQTINQASSTTNITSSVNPSGYGTPVTFTATVPGAGATGIVTFMDSGTSMGTGILTSGTATFTTSTLTVAGSPHQITAAYSGDANYGGSTSLAVNQIISKATTTTSVISSLPTATFGNSVTFTANVTSAGGTPTGTVTFMDSGTSLGTGILTSGTATFTTSNLTVAGSPHSITAVYNADANFLGSTSSTLAENINKASTTTGILSSANPSTFGNSVTFTANVTSAGGIPTGMVTFMDGVTSIGTGTLTSGTATYATSVLTVAGSPHSITAVYNADANFSGSASSILAQNVQKNISTTSVSPSATTLTYGSPVTFTATITGSGATGTVTFNDGGVPIGTATLTAGIATYTTSTLVALPHSITASYNGDGNYNGSTSSSVIVTISKASTIAGITSNIQVSAISEPVTFTATIASTGGIPTGSVVFMDGLISLGTGTLTNGTAVLTVALTNLGVNSITAQYNGDANFSNSTSTPLVQTVVHNTTTTNIALSGGTNPSTYGTLLSFSSTVTGTGGTPSGTVTFQDNGATIIGTSTLNGSGIATFSTTTLGGGSHAITATYSGDANYGGSTSSPALAQFVNTAPQTITFVLSQPTTTYGVAPYSLSSSVTSGLTATYGSSNTNVATVNGNQVTIVGAGTATITAYQAGNANYSAATPVPQTLTVNPANQTITFGALAAAAYGNADFAPGASASSGLAITYSSSNTSVASIVNGNIHIVSAGTTTITASQGGNSNYIAAANVSQPLIVNKAATAAAVSSNAGIAVLGNTVTFTATIAGAGATGVVTFMDGVTSIGTGTLTAGTVTYSTAALTTGAHSITAVYSGDGNFLGSTSSIYAQNVVVADGIFNGHSGSVNATDALAALRIAAGIDTASQNDLAHGDVAPLANGQRDPDGKIDISDVVAILRKAAGLSSW